MKVSGEIYKIALFLVLIVLAACHTEHDHRGKTPLVEAGGQFLYREDLQTVIPPGISSADSLSFAERYIREWVEDALLYEKAKNNIPDNDRIEALVDNYRKTLIVHTYQQQLIEQRLKDEISDEEVRNYYESNKNLFLVDVPLVRGVFVKVPLRSPGVNKVRTWYKKNTPENRDQLERYSFQHAVGYEYFYDRWVSARDVIDKIPLTVDNPEQYLAEHAYVETKDTANYYFLHVDAYLKKGEQKPLEFAQAEIRGILSNMKRVAFMREVKEELYERATKRNRIIYYK